MGLFSDAQMDKINDVAKKSNASLKSTKRVSSDSINKELNESSNAVLEYFSDAKSILITSEEQLHDYITECIKAGIAGIDTETTGLDRIKDTVVGCSLYYPGGTECYIPNKHIVPLFEEPYKDQLTYEQTAKELQRLVDNNVKLVFANADFDLAMIYKDYHVDLCDVCYYDVIIAWRCIKEDEKKNGLKELYNKYVLKGKGDPMKFSDFFSPKTFPYCKPQIAKLYAANDAKITYELCMWQMPYITKGTKKCEKKHLEHIADLVWNIEFPLIKVCQKMHRTGSYLDKETAKVINKRYNDELQKESAILADMVQAEIDKQPYVPDEISKRPFKSGKDFKPNSNPQVSYLLYKMMNLTPPPTGNGKNSTKNESTSKKVLEQFNLPITNQILKVRSIDTLINTFVQKLPNATTSDSRIHAEYKQIGADCVVGDTIIPTKEYGDITIKELYDNLGTDITEEHLDIDVTIINKYGEFESAESIIKYENWDTIRIICKNGFQLEGTYNHPILLQTENGEFFQELQNVKIGDKVLLANSNVKKYSNIIKIYHQKSDVYDLYVPVTHSFVSNGIISHNTGRMSCIAKGTMVTLLNGEKPIEDVQIGDLAYCYDENGGLHLSEVTNVIYKGVQKCVDVKWQSSGTGKIGHLICTPEHKILLKSGEWMDASCLTRYQKVAHLHRTNDNVVNERPRVFGWNNICMLEQDVVKKDIFKVSDDESSKYVVHHKDFNKYNNDLSNLRLMPKDEHTRYHTHILMEQGRIKPIREYLPPDFDYSKYVRYGKDSPNYIDVSKDELIDMIKDADGKLSHIHMDYDTFKKKCLENDVDYVAEARKYNPKYYKNRPTLSEFKQKFEEFDGDESKICDYFHMKHFNYNCYMRDCGYSTNHMIQIVSDAGFYDVYDLEIKDYHNFIANEICVHNCSNPNLQNIPSHANDIRHMFRATPETNQIVTIESDEDEKVNLEVSYYDKLYNENNELVSVHDLKVGDSIKVQDDNDEDIVLQIESIADTKSDLSRCNIILVPEVIDNEV